MWHSDTMEHYLAIKKKNKVLVHAKTWMDLENFMQIERSQLLKTTFV